MKKSYRIIQLQFYKGTHTHTSYTSPENYPSRIQFYMQKTKSSSSTTSRTRNSTHRRQRDLLEIHPCILQDPPKTFQAFQPQDLPKAFQTFQSFMTFQPIQAILQVPVSPGNPPHSSIPGILQLECIFYSSIGFHRKLHRVPVERYKHFFTNISFFKEREMLRYRSI